MPGQQDKPNTVSSGSARLALAVAALALLWLAVYWLTPAPDREAPPPITWAEPEPATAAQRAQPAADTVPELQDVPDPLAEPVAQGVIPPEFDTYIVQPGDDAWSISRAHYGTDRYWRRIKEANPFVDFSRLRAGRELRVPRDPDNVQGLLVGPDGQTEPPPPPPAETQYIVSKGDTLTGIAKALYGRASLWTIIRDANLDKVNRAGTNIRPGMKLIIPPPPERARP